jgi:TPR repeat protein
VDLASGKSVEVGRERFLSFAASERGGEPLLAFAGPKGTSFAYRNGQAYVVEPIHDASAPCAIAAAADGTVFVAVGTGEGTLARRSPDGRWSLSAIGLDSGSNVDLALAPDGPVVVRRCMLAEWHGQGFVRTRLPCAIGYGSAVAVGADGRVVVAHVANEGEGDHLQIAVRPKGAASFAVTDLGIVEGSPTGRPALALDGAGRVRIAFARSAGRVLLATEQREGDPPVATDAERAPGACMAFFEASPRQEPVVERARRFCEETKALWPEARAFVEHGCAEGDGRMCTLLGAARLPADAAFRSDQSDLMIEPCETGSRCHLSTRATSFSPVAGAEPDVERAIAALTRACELGVAVGCDALGRTKETRSVAGATEAYLRACELGRDVACRSLVLEAINRHTRPSPAVLAVVRDRLVGSCEGGDGGSCNMLGALVEWGWLSRKDVGDPVQRYIRACGLGNRHACARIIVRSALATAMVPRAELTRAVAVLEESCGQRADAHSCAALGVALSRGFGVARNPARAKALFDDACQNELKPCKRLPR